MSERVTLKLVAAHACVSYQTVSRVVNHKPEVASDTRQRVLSAIGVLGYRPRSRTPHPVGSTVIGVLVPAIPDSTAANPLLAHVVWGIYHAAAARETSLLLFSLDTSGPDPWPPALVDCALAGVIVAGHASDSQITWLLRRDCPLIIAGYAGPAGGRVHVVHSDDEGGAYGIIHHLLALGHRRVGLLGQILSPAEHARWSGCVRAFRDAGLECDPPLPADEDSIEPPGYRAVAHLMQQPQPPTAILAFSVHMMPGITRWLRENDYRVPDDLSLAAFDDTAGSQIVDPGLTTVDLFPADLGRKAAALLLEAIEGGPTTVGETIVPTRLVVRGSTAVAPTRSARRPASVGRGLAAQPAAVAPTR